MTREEAIRILLAVELDDRNVTDETIKAISIAIKSLKQEPRKGHWIYTGSYDEDGILICSECNFRADVSEHTNFCPNCGAEMKAVELPGYPDNPFKKPKGKWIKEKSPYGWDGKSYQCSECGRSIHLDTEIEDLEDYPYCHCGADMRESEVEE